MKIRQQGETCSAIFKNPINNYDWQDTDCPEKVHLINKNLSFIGIVLSFWRSSLLVRAHSLHTAKCWHHFNILYLKHIQYVLVFGIFRFLGSLENTLFHQINACLICWSSNTFQLSSQNRNGTEKILRHQRLKIMKYNGRYTIWVMLSMENNRYLTYLCSAIII